jgi:hypothetical protein
VLGRRSWVQAVSTCVAPRVLGSSLELRLKPFAPLGPLPLHGPGAVVSLLRSPPAADRQGSQREGRAAALGLALVRPDRAASGLLGRRTGLPPAEDLLAEATAATGGPAATEEEAADYAGGGCGGAMTDGDEVVMVVKLQPEVPYLVVPSLSEPGAASGYELRLFSSAPLELQPLRGAACVSLPGAWDAESAGGCDLHGSSWFTNPAYWLQLPRHPCSFRWDALLLFMFAAVAPLKHRLLCVWKSDHCKHQQLTPFPTTILPASSRPHRAAWCCGATPPGNGARP